MPDPHPAPQSAPTPEPVIPAVALPISVWVARPAAVAAALGAIGAGIAHVSGGVALDAFAGALAAAAAITAGGLLIAPWKARRLNEIGPFLLASQGIAFASVIALGAVGWNTLAPHGPSFGFTLAAAFLPALLVQAQGFAGVANAAMPPKSAGRPGGDGGGTAGAGTAPDPAE